MKGIYPNLIQSFKSTAPEDIKIPSIVAAELFYGAEKSNAKAKTLKVMESFLLPFEIIAFGKDESRIYGKLRKELESVGKLIGPNDLIIAAIVISHKGKLITNNLSEFNWSISI